MGRSKSRFFYSKEAVEFLKKAVHEDTVFRLVVPLFLVLWVVEKWFFSLSNWVALALAVWVTVQYGSYTRMNLEENLNKKWKQLTLQASSITPLEQCEWLNKLLIDVWPNYINPKLSSRFSYIIERRLKNRKSRLIEKIELREFSLGSRPPMIGLHGIRWTSSGDQKVMGLGFDWDTTDVNMLMYAKLAPPLMGSTQIIVNSIHIKGDLLLVPVLDGKAVIWSFVSTPEIRVGVAFGSGESQSLPATELPGVSSWLVKIAMDTMNKKMVEPQRECLALPAVDLLKKAVGGALCVTVVSADKLSFSKGGTASGQPNSAADVQAEDSSNKDLQTFVEIELEELSRKTNERAGSNPEWGSTFNLILNDNTASLKFNLYACNRAAGCVKSALLTSCQVKMRYVPDDSTIFWAIGANSTVISKHAESCGEEVEMIVLFEGVDSGELTVRFVLKEWQFSDGSHSSGSYHPLKGISNDFSKTGRKICITVVEGKNLVLKEKNGKSEPYVKLQYGKSIRRTKSASRSTNPIWNQKFEFEEIGDGEHLEIKCYTEEAFTHGNIGIARVNLEGLVEGSVRDVCIPLRKVNSGELRLQIETAKSSDGNSEGSRASSHNGSIELVLIEARDLVAADLRGTSDPYVRVDYGNVKRRTKVIFKTLNPKWNQTLEFLDDGSPLVLHVKDHNSVLPTSSIGDCVVEYQMLAPNETADKWIPLQGVTRGEIHIQITRKIPDVVKKLTTKLHHKISNEMKQMMIKIQSSLEDSDLTGVSKSLSELETLHDTQEEYMLQLETERNLLIDKVNELGREILSSPSSSSSSFSS